MSAFLCDAAHLSALANAVRGTDRWGIPHELEDAMPEDIFRFLLWANVESLVARYGESDSMDPDSYDPWARYATAVQLLKGVHCFTYQACEVDDWEHSPAKRYCDAIEASAIRQLPGYDAARWGGPA